MEATFLKSSLIFSRIAPKVAPKSLSLEACGNCVKFVPVNSRQISSARNSLVAFCVSTAESKDEALPLDSEPETQSSKNEQRTPTTGRARRLEKLLKRRDIEFEKAKEFSSKGIVCRVKAEAANNGGLVVKFGVLRGFVPYSQLDQSRLWQDGEKKDALAIGTSMVGQQLTVLIMDLREKDSQIIFSEKEALMYMNLKKVKIGEVYKGKVSLISDFGAFVDVTTAKGTYLMTGLVHSSEISWDLVTNIRDYLQIGDSVKVKVIGVDSEKRRLSLSIKQLQNDPLLETLDMILPAVDEPTTEETRSLEASYASVPLFGLDEICKELEMEPSVLSVTLGRKVVEKRVVSQDLELWLSNAPAKDGEYTLLARAGRQVQELSVMSRLTREEMKEAIQRVTSRVS